MSNTAFDITATSNDLTIDLKLNTPEAIAWVKANMVLIPDMQKSESEISLDVLDTFGIDPFVKNGLKVELDGSEMFWYPEQNIAAPNFEMNLTAEELAEWEAEGF